MFDSKILVSSLINDLVDEVDIAIDIPNSYYVSWLNALEQLLYSEIIKEQKEIILPFPDDNKIDLLELEHSYDESDIRFEDIHAVYAGKKQLIKTTITSGVIFPDTYFKTNNCLGVSASFPEEIKIVYYVRPALKEIDAQGKLIDSTIMVPVEFIDLVRAKLRGEAYKVANEDALAAKWLNDYNVLLDTFSVWVANKSSNFGI